MASSKPVWRPALCALAICALVWLAGVGVYLVVLRHW